MSRAGPFFAATELPSPIRGEIFSSDRLERFGESLAASHAVRPGIHRGRRLLPRLRENGTFLLSAYRSIARAIRAGRPISPAAEWLADNFHVVEEQVREILEDLPPAYHRELPKLARGPLEGYPRVYALAWSFVEHNDSRFDPEALVGFVRGYQRVQPLTIGELWAVAILLRIVLVENLRRLVERIVRRQGQREKADALADRLLAVERDGDASDQARKEVERRPLSTAFVVQLVDRLRDRDPEVTAAVGWLNARLAAEGTTPDELVQAEHHEQVATQVTVRNVITSMRLLSSVDWKEFFEKVSLVEEALREGTDVAAMDFATRDRYRHAVEDLSRGSKYTELEVARLAAERARTARARLPEDARRGDPGYYLISKGRAEFEEEIGFRVSPRQWLRRAYVAAATPGYLVTIAATTASILALPLVASWTMGVPAPLLLLLALLALVPASNLAIAIVNRDVTELVGPRRLPKLELADGVPRELATLVAIPALLSGEAEIEELVERIEVHYLANPEPELTFALVTDWLDSPQELLPEDEVLLAEAREAIARLNARHPTASGRPSRFLLLHRHRVWNAAQGVWMGWERKRGKLHELNRLLRGARDTSFLSGGETVPDGVRFVITLDADTRLGRRVARRLVGAMAHPLNQPAFDPRTEVVVEGYGLLQPRVTPLLPSTGDGTLFQRTFSGPPGIDPYAFAVSDVYQDLFGEGTYTGKGIYDVDAFERALGGRVPENALLSHDLFEGLFARAGLVSDVELFEGFPAHYEVAVARQRRWARGDWQLLPWILGIGRDPRGKPRSQGISTIGRWKMIDNLRRSLVAPASLLTLLAGWALPGAVPVLWTAFVLATISLPGLFHVFAGLLPRRRGISKRSFLRGLAGDASVALWQAVLETVLLAHQACLMTDAIVRTLWRLATRRRLLEWVAASQSNRGLDLRLSGFTRRMAPAVVLAVATFLVFSFLSPTAWPVVFLFCALWAASPAFARAASLPPRTFEHEALAIEAERVLRLVARRTWRYFEEFVGPEEHHLPPDNVQEDPHAIAHRTSPTNVGLYLISTVSAHDLGWIGTGEFVERIESTLATMSEMERFRGHFYNWYDTRSLRPLEPRYVSTVDSGNLAGHLLTLSRACLEQIDEPVVSDHAFSGISDTLAVARSALRKIPEGRRGGAVSRRDIEGAFTEIESALAPRPATVADWGSRLDGISTHAEAATDMAEVLADERRDDDSAELLAWCRAVRGAVASHRRDFESFLGWTRLLEAEPARSFEKAPEGELLAGVPPVLSEVPDLYARLAENPAGSPRAEAARRERKRSEGAAADLARRLTRIARSSEQMVMDMNFRFLFDDRRKLFSIGYRLSDGRLDAGYYDLLASEARLTSFIAIAFGEVSASHWFQLGRPLTPVGTGSALVSWSGSMFEYLMPKLVMRVPSGSLLDQTSRLVVARQIQHGREHGVPWGVSESAYSARDLDLTYQYSNFGLPGLGLKRGLSEDLVIAPYATALAAMVDPAAAARNFEHLSRVGAEGRYGFYEALDYTADRLPEGTKVAIVRAHMAHHHGMTVVALANVLEAGVIRSRFHSHPSVQATELLLQERTPRGVAVARPRAEELSSLHQVLDSVPSVLRRFESPHDLTPRTHLLSNGRYSVMITAAGSGYSRWRDLAVTRWREDATRDCWGSYVFLRDTESGAVWSAAYQPSGVEADQYDVAYSEDHVEIHRRDGSIATTQHVVVSAEDDAEVRQISISNHGLRPREVEVTSYAEIVLANPAADAAHPAFSKLFVRTEHVPGSNVLLATRRPREAQEEPVWAAHVMSAEGEGLGAVQYETDRARFLSRGRSIRNPAAIIDGRPLSNTAGPVLDPIFSLQQRLRISPGTTVRVAFTTLVAPSREAALAAVDKYREPAAFERTVNLAWTQAQVQLRHLGIGPDEAHLFQRLGTRIIYSDLTLRASPETLQRNERGPSGLWRHGVSGDLPIVLVRIDHPEDTGIVRQLLRAHHYWRMKGLAVDLVIVNERAASYSRELQEGIETLIRMSQVSSPADTHEGEGGVFVVKGDALSESDRDLLRTSARAVLLSRHGTLAEQTERLLRAQPPPDVPPRADAPSRPEMEVPPPRPRLDFFNGLGGFAEAGREYVTVLGEGQWTPAPWINVVANRRFGFQASESGSGYTWSGNSRENKLSPWSNDPICDPPGEALLVRDEETGEIWGPTALPVREEWPYLARHGQGYSRFEHESHGIALDLLVFVPLEDPVKISRLRIENRSGRTRRLSLTAYVEWALGVSRESSAPYIVSELDPETRALFARNPWNEEFGGSIAFADLAGRQTAWTADRTEFLGRNGDLARPAALARGRELSGRVGAGLDPCAALQQVLTIAAGGNAEVLFLLGEAESRDAARTLLSRYRAADVEECLGEVRRRWDDILGALRVQTPDPSMDIMLNRWLLYQTLACRIWARSAFYQSGGAYGFRDQLQDVMALTVAQRGEVRAHLLRSAARQFKEGDVQHWWHPHSGKGIRTRFSDDLLWLPYAVTHYLEVTEDETVLDERLPFLEGPPLEPEQQEAFFEPKVSSEGATLFEHCALALDARLTVGRHGLPLMGSGDWNDGMNRVGVHGEGESVWLAWFLHTNLWEWARLAEKRGEKERALRWREHVGRLKEALEREAWDGDWYLRAFYDDGTPVGSARDSECRIDSIAQSWGIITGAADPERRLRAMAAVEQYLVRRGDGVVLLFTPPFDKTTRDPGYIKGYLPGIRENGGQYTHAALWAVIAFAGLGDGDKAGELFGILNPINHASTRAGLHRYKIEPYVAAADVYSENPHAGRGGWSWYTGSAGWMYRAGIEWILGLRLRGATLYLDPCIPRAWPRFEVAFRYHSALYELAVENPFGVTRGVSKIEMDGQPVEVSVRGIPLQDDGMAHRIRATLGSSVL